ncbi:MAG: ribbon-helix-helix domain-containing protein [Microcoleaceae cyanobacterium]
MTQNKFAVDLGEDLGGKVQQARITAYLPHEVKARLEELAEAEDRTLSNFVSIVLKRYVEQNSKPNETELKDTSGDQK